MMKKKPNTAALFGVPNMTHEEIAQKMGISRQAVEVIEKRALRKLREAFAKMGITSMSDIMAVG